MIQTQIKKITNMFSLKVFHVFIVLKDTWMFIVHKSMLVTLAKSRWFSSEEIATSTSAVRCSALLFIFARCGSFSCLLHESNAQLFFFY